MDEERETEKESNPKFGLALEKIEQHIEEQAESYKKWQLMSERCISFTIMNLLAG